MTSGTRGVVTPHAELDHRYTRNQQFAAVSALIYLGAGLLGFVVTGTDGFTADTDEKLLFLGLNPLHNVVHLVLAAAWALAAMTAPAARAANLALGVGLLAAFVLGVAGGATWLNIDDAAEPDNYLHLAWGVLSVAVAMTERVRGAAGIR